ncbi:uncharacterized protein C18orf19 homolog A [Drosophila tropicalis]|uniref:uncharacterized protein C18orf19 homolog A n=1 Tax=Drosophila tropicalis TaxID=46794 RepID=UPI0035ABD967
MAAVALLARFLGNNPLKQRNFVCLRMLQRQSSFSMCHSHSQSHARCLSLSLRSNFSCSSCNSPGDHNNSRRNILSPLVSSKFSTKSSTTQCHKPETKNSSTASPSTTENDLFGEAANMGLFAKFKHMYKQYWYVLIPVHVVTSVGWFGGFYYLSKSGVDIPALLQYIPLSESALESIQGSDMGHYAFAYLCYKLLTPARYALTLGCTTVSIKYLVQRGYIKPIPTKNELIKMYEDKKATRASAKADKAEKAEKEKNRK